MGAPPPFDREYEVQVEIKFGKPGPPAAKKAFWEDVAKILTKYRKGPNIFQLYPDPESPETAEGYVARAQPVESTPAAEKAFMQAFKDVRQELEGLKGNQPHNALDPHVDEYENVTYIKGGTTRKKLRDVVRF